ncbi:hypothetical protein scyTo_0014014, partial [Scyliorhinus torazame]|nr:hypothetical protein [Scyliorhinus torazame]
MAVSCWLFFPHLDMLFLRPLTLVSDRMELSSPQSLSCWDNSTTRKRRAWARSRDQWQTVDENLTDTSCHSGDSVDKIKSWLEDCGSRQTSLQEETNPPGLNGAFGLSIGNSFEDDLSLGAE